MDDRESLLLVNETFHLTPWRWFILCFFSIANCNQCLAWFSFSSTDEATMQQYFGPGMTKDTLDLLLNWGPIIGIVFFPVQTWVLQQPGGLRRGMWWGMLLLLLGNSIRSVPVFISAVGWDAGFVRSGVAYGMYHVGQILIAASGERN